MSRIPSFRRFGRRVINHQVRRYRQSRIHTKSISAATRGFNTLGSPSTNAAQMEPEYRNLAANDATKKPECEGLSCQHLNISSEPDSNSTALCLAESGSGNLGRTENIASPSSQKSPYCSLSHSEGCIAVKEQSAATANTEAQTLIRQSAFVKCVTVEEDVAKLEIHLPLFHFGHVKTCISHAGTEYTAEEKQLIKRLKERPGAGTWREICQEYSKVFPGRSPGSIQVHYSRKIRQR